MPDKKLTDNEIVKALRSWLEEIRKSRQAYLEKINEEHFPSMRYEYLLSDTIHELKRLQEDSSRLKKVQMQLDDLCKMHNIIKSEAYKEFAEKAIEQVEKVRQKYQRLCKEQGEEMEEHMHIHFNGIIGIINNLLKETYTSSVAEATPSPPNKGEG